MSMIRMEDEVIMERIEVACKERFRLPLGTTCNLPDRGEFAAESFSRDHHPTPGTRTRNINSSFEALF